jgi:hypothetical protein
LPFRDALIPSFGRSGWPAKPHFPARISKQRHGTVSFLSRLTVPPFSSEHDPEKWEPVFPRDKRETRLRGDHAQTKDAIMMQIAS